MSKWQNLIIEICHNLYQILFKFCWIWFQFEEHHDGNISGARIEYFVTETSHLELKQWISIFNCT